MISAVSSKPGGYSWNQILTDVVLAVLKELSARLPSNLRNEILPHRTDPQRLRKKETDLCRMRLLPATKAPAYFWSSSWCFYEIGVGHYSRRGGEGLNLGGIS